MKKRKLLAAGATLLACLAFMPACTNKDNRVIFIENNQSVTDDATRITFYGFKYNEPDLIAIENSIHSFMDIHPEINVNYEGIVNDDSQADSFYKIFDLRLASGHLDDVFMLKQDKRMEQMVFNKDLLDLRGVIDLDAYTSLVQSQILYPDIEDPSVPDHIYFVPMALTSYGLYVNYDLLKSDGQSVPTDFEEFTAVCNFYVRKYASEGKSLCPIICNNKRSMRTIVQAYGLYDLYQLPDSTDIIKDYNENPAPLAEDYLYKGLEFAKGMLDSGWIDPQKTQTTAQTNAEKGDMFEFIKGEQPFMITGSWATNRITNTEAGKKMNYGVHPLPFLSKEKGGATLIFDIDICTAVNARSKELDAAKTFISYFTNPESVWEYCNTNNSYSPLANETRKPDNKTLEPHLAYYTNGKAVLGTNYMIYTFNLNNAIDGATDMLLNGKSLDEAYGKLKAGLGL